MYVKQIRKETLTNSLLILISYINLDSTYKQVKIKKIVQSSIVCLLVSVREAKICACIQI